MRCGGFSAPKLLKIPKLSTSTKFSKKAQNPPYCKTDVGGSVFFRYYTILQKSKQVLKLICFLVFIISDFFMDMLTQIGLHLVDN